MNSETLTQRRARLIEQYAGLACRAVETEWGKQLPNIDQIMPWAERLADAVIAATPQPEPTRYPSEIETWLIELLERAIQFFKSIGYPDMAAALETQLAAIKRDLGLS